METKIVEDEINGEILTSGPATWFLEISVPTLHKYVRLGLLKARRTTSGQWLFRRSDLEAFKKTRKRYRRRSA